MLTVSPNYSKEIQTASGGFNLQEPILKKNSLHFLQESAERSTSTQ